MQDPPFATYAKKRTILGFPDEIVSVPLISSGKLPVVEGNSMTGKVEFYLYENDPEYLYCSKESTRFVFYDDITVTLVCEDECDPMKWYEFVRGPLRGVLYGRRTIFEKKKAFANNLDYLGDYKDSRIEINSDHCIIGDRTEPHLSVLLNTQRNNTLARMKILNALYKEDGSEHITLLKQVIKQKENLNDKSPVAKR